MAKGIKTGGRQKGSLNKATADIKALARNYTEEAMAALIGIIRESESDAAKVSAIKEVFDRGYGKAKQPLIGGDDDDPAMKMVAAIEWRVVDSRP
jgi:hypothetical protein